MEVAMCSWCVYKILGAHCRHEEGRERNVWRKKKKWMTTIVDQKEKYKHQIQSKHMHISLIPKAFPAYSDAAAISSFSNIMGWNYLLLLC